MKKLITQKLLIVVFFFFLFLFFSCNTTKALYNYSGTAAEVRENYGRLENEESGITEDFNISATYTEEAKKQAEEEGSLIERLKKLMDEIRNGECKQNKRTYH